VLHVCCVDRRGPVLFLGLSGLHHLFVKILIFCGLQYLAVHCQHSIGQGLSQS
jgi:hypothetical protein